MKAPWKAQAIPRRVRKAGAGPHTSMVIKMTIFSAAPVELVDFDAAEKMVTESN